MKKEYSSPDILFESFSLSVAIANCSFKTNNPNNSSCGYFMPGFGDVFISEEISGCKVVITDQMSYELNGFCYHVPVENQTMFSS